MGGFGIVLVAVTVAILLWMLWGQKPHAPVAPSGLHDHVKYMTIGKAFTDLEQARSSE